MCLLWRKRLDKLIISSLGTQVEKVKTVRTIKPKHLKPEPNVKYLLEPIETRTWSCLKFKTETEEFWNRTSSNVQFTTQNTCHVLSKYKILNCHLKTIIPILI